MRTYRVRVAEGWVVYDGECQRHGGEVVEATEEQAVEWLRNGWIDREVPSDEED